MSTINVYSVANHLESEGWRLISTEYKNLDSNLEMMCPKGHKQIQTYKQWRKNPVCEECLGGISSLSNIVPPKQENVQRILALDAATNTTGFALFDDAALIKYGIIHATSGSTSTERINQMKHWLINIIQEWQPNLIGIEHVQLQSYGPHGNQQQVETYRILANLQGVLLDTCYEYHTESELVYASTWRQYCNISCGPKDRENKKKAAQEKVKLWYNLKCTQDEADAICIGKYFCAAHKKSSWGEPI